MTIPSTTAGNAGFIGIVVNTATGITIASVTNVACAGTWTQFTSFATSLAGNGSIDLWYCTNLTGGSTTATANASSTGWTGGGAVEFWEAHSTTGSIALDAGATPSANHTDTTCTACAGAALTLAGNNDFIVVMAICAGTCTGVSGSGYSLDNNPSGHGVGHAITGTSQTAPATWIQGSGTLVCGAGALQDGSTFVATNSPTRTLMGVGP